MTIFGTSEQDASIRKCEQSEQTHEYLQIKTQRYLYQMFHFFFLLEWYDVDMGRWQRITNSLSVFFFSLYIRR